MTSDSLISVNLILENCEVINIPIKYIGYLDAKDFKRNIHISNGNFDDFLICESFIIEIFKEIDRDIKYNPFNSNKQKLIIKRLSDYADITQIEFVYEDKTELFYVDWDGSSDEINNYQDTYISDLGNIYISISKDKRLKDYFNEDTFKRLNNYEYMIQRKIDLDINDPIDEEKVHKFTQTDLPKFYKYVYLHFNDKKNFIAIRVPDKDLIFKFIFESDNNDELKNQTPNLWHYPSKRIADFINRLHQSYNDGFTIKEIMKRYPLVSIL